MARLNGHFGFGFLDPENWGSFTRHSSPGRVSFHTVLRASWKERKYEKKKKNLKKTSCLRSIVISSYSLRVKFLLHVSFFNAAFHTWSSRFGRCVFEAFSWAIGYTHIVVSLWKLFQLKFMNTNLKCTGKYTRISGQYFTRRFATVGSQCWSIALRIVSELLAYLQKQL